MTSQKTISAIGVGTSAVAAVTSAWSYAQAGDLYFVAAAAFFTLASAFELLRFRRIDRSDLPSFRPAGATHTVAKFVGFTGACWLLILLRMRSGAHALFDPINLIILLVSLTALILGIQFALQSRESRRN